MLVPLIFRSRSPGSFYTVSDSGLQLSDGSEVCVRFLPWKNGLAKENQDWLAVCKPDCRLEFGSHDVTPQF
jgi:hypothetical protein